MKLTEQQKRNAKAAGITVEEAVSLIREQRINDMLDRKEYKASSDAEKDAHDNK